MQQLVDFIKNLQESADYQTLQQLTEEQLEKKYLEGYTFYEAHIFQRATEIFQQLVITAPYSKKYWFAYSSSLQQERKYRDALQAWSVAVILDRNNPLPQFHAAECMLSINEKKEAIKALNIAEKLCIEDSILLLKIRALKEQNK